MFLSTRTDPVQKVEIGARRAPGERMRTRARNSIGAGPWSDPATIMVT